VGLYVCVYHDHRTRRWQGGSAQQEMRGAKRGRNDGERWEMCQPRDENLDTITARAMNAHNRHFSYNSCRHVVGEAGAAGTPFRAASSAFAVELGRTTVPLPTS